VKSCAGTGKADPVRYRRSKFGKMAAPFAAALLVLSVSGCGHQGGRGTAITKLSKELATRDVQSRLVDRSAGLVGPPFVEHCDPPLIAWRLGDAGGRHGFATIYICQSNAQARTASVPELPGQRFRSENFIAVVSADARLARDVQAAIRRAG
jgi:hypothetical protein